jgi:hypothetical protein
MREPYPPANTALSISRPLNVFYSYSHQDEAFRVELEKHLSLMRRQGEIAGWHDRKIGAGTEWKKTIDQNLRNADIILLLVSADFLASDYCYDNEMKQAMKLHQEGSARVIPIILRDCDWSSAPFAKLQALPKNAKPLKAWTDPDEGYHDIVRGIREAAARFEDVRPVAPTELTHQTSSIFGVGKIALIGICLLLIVGWAFVWLAQRSQDPGKADASRGKGDQPGAQSATVGQATESILVTGFVVDSAGNGIEGVQVRVENLATISPVTTASSGGFIIKDMPGKPGDLIWLVFSKEGYGQQREQYQLNGLQKQIIMYPEK